MQNSPAMLSKTGLSDGDSPGVVEILHTNVLIRYICQYKPIRTLLALQELAHH